MKITNILGTLGAFIRALGSSAAPGAGEGVLSTHLDDLNGKPLALLQGQALNAAQFGLPMMLQNDGNALMARGDRFGGIATAAIQPLLSWFVEGTTINTRLFTSFAATMTATQTVQGVTLNASNLNNLSTSYQFNTVKQVPLHMKAPLLMRMRARFSVFGAANANADFGFTAQSGSLGQTANLNGAYWRLDASGVIPVLAINGAVVATGTAVAGLNAANFYHWGIIKDDDVFIFLVQDASTGVMLSRQPLQIPAGQQKAFLASHAQPYVRTFNSAVAPTAGCQVLLSEWAIGVLDTNLNMTPAQIATVIGLGSENGPLTYTTTSNIANATVAATTVPTNTTATATSLDGAIRFAAPVGSTTDLALFSYTVPSPYQYRCKRVLVAIKNLGAAVATTPTQVDLFLSVNGAGVTLVGALNRKYIGTQTFAVGAAIGASAIEGPIAIDLSEADLITEAGRVITLVARISTGTATASQVLEVMYTNLGHFE